MLLLAVVAVVAPAAAKQICTDVSTFIRLILVYDRESNVKDASFVLNEYWKHVQQLDFEFSQEN